MTARQKHSRRARLLARTVGAGGNWGPSASQNTGTCGTQHPASTTAPRASRRTQRPSAGMPDSSQGQIPAQEITTDRMANLVLRHADKIVVDATGCWQWTGATAGQMEYGNLWCPEEKRMVRAHRAFFQAAFGQIPDGKIVLHDCDNPKCCNPQHLRAGTQSENIRDMHNKGRSKHSTPTRPCAKYIYKRRNTYRVQVKHNGRTWTAFCKTFCEAFRLRSALIRRLGIEPQFTPRKQNEGGC